MKLTNLFLSFLYPNRCGICNHIQSNSLCKKCENKLKLDETYKIDNYSHNPFLYFEKHHYLFQYQGIIREKIIEYKFQKKAYLSQMFATIIKSQSQLIKNIEQYDIIIPVPIHKKRKQERGYNQTELILKQAITKKQIIHTTVLIKTKDNKPQSTLTKEKRKKNVKNTYEILKSKKEIIKNKTILLFDDIYTTGSTANECSRLLKQAGAKKIDILTIAKDEMKKCQNHE